MCSSVTGVERLRENLAGFNEKLFKNLYQDRVDGPITGHVLVQVSRFRKSFSAKSAKFPRNRSRCCRVPMRCLQGYLAHKKAPSPWNPQKAYAYGPKAVLGGEAFSYERVTGIPRS